MAGSILKKVLEAMTSPRRAALGASDAQAGAPADRPGHRLHDPAHARGLAFVELLEHLPTDHLHRPVAATLVVHVDEVALHERLRAALTDTDEVLSAGAARRLACGAGILPAVLGGASVPLDLRRRRRFFTESQALALSIKHRTCAAEGCERPFAWCELHHLHPWARGGPTDLRFAVPLCGFHHRRVHDPRYRVATTAVGSLLFRLRT